ncbi:MAG: hypothetical protein K9G60_07900, partial [Pseudolabrys sp.]|nr:hypothetical protein [Pseudolabrys sp.]
MNWRRLIFTACAVFAFAVVAPVSIASVGVAHAQMSAEFQAALQPYGSWHRHARWGLVWVPAHRPRGWRPYTYGHWVYTDDWGWYWISDREEEDFGWVTYHYGRWVLDRRMGWVWVRGEQWAPAWVNWRRGGDYLGWAPLPPDAVIDDYDNVPAYWIFVQPRYLGDARLRRHLQPPTRTQALLRGTVVVNRTLVPERSRVAVNAGIAPAIVGAAARSPVQTYRVAPRVTAGTQGVTGAVTVRPQDFSRRRRRGARPFDVSIQRTSVVKPAASVPQPKALGKDERGRLGLHAPQPQKQPQTPAAPPARPDKRSAT